MTSEEYTSKGTPALSTKLPAVHGSICTCDLILEYYIPYTAYISHGLNFAFFAFWKNSRN